MVERNWIGWEMTAKFSYDMDAKNYFKNGRQFYLSNWVLSAW